MIKLYFPPYSNDGRIKPKTDADNITPAAKANIISEILCEIFLKTKPINEPKIVDAPTPNAVNRTIDMFSSIPKFN